MDAAAAHAFDSPGWYYTVTGRWLSARYVAAIGATPHRCH